MSGVVANFGVFTQVPLKRNGLFSGSRQNPMTRSPSKSHISSTFHGHSKTVSPSCHHGMKLLSQAQELLLKHFSTQRPVSRELHSSQVTKDVIISYLIPCHLTQPPHYLFLWFSIWKKTLKTDDTEVQKQQVVRLCDSLHRLVFLSNLKTGSVWFLHLWNKTLFDLK